MWTHGLRWGVRPGKLQFAVSTVKEAQCAPYFVSMWQPIKKFLLLPVVEPHSFCQQSSWTKLSQKPRGKDPFDSHTERSHCQWAYLLLPEAQQLQLQANGQIWTTARQLQSVPSAMKLYLGWERQQPIIIRNWGQPSSEAFGCHFAIMRKLPFRSRQNNAQLSYSSALQRKCQVQKTLNIWHHLWLWLYTT